MRQSCKYGSAAKNNILTLQNSWQAKTLLRWYTRVMGITFANQSQHTELFIDNGWHMCFAYMRVKMALAEEYNINIHVLPRWASNFSNKSRCHICTKSAPWFPLSMEQKNLTCIPMRNENMVVIKAGLGVQRLPAQSAQDKCFTQCQAAIKSATCWAWKHDEIKWLDDFGTPWLPRLNARLTLAAAFHATCTPKQIPMACEWT